MILDMIALNIINPLKGIFFKKKAYCGVLPQNVNLQKCVDHGQENDNSNNIQHNGVIFHHYRQQCLFSNLIFRA